MNEDRIAGTARNPGNNVKESVGRVTGHAKGQADGLINQAAGAAQDLYGQARETASDAAYLVRQGATDAEHYVRRIIESVGGSRCWREPAPRNHVVSIKPKKGLPHDQDCFRLSGSRGGPAACRRDSGRGVKPEDGPGRRCTDRAGPGRQGPRRQDQRHRDRDRDRGDRDRRRRDGSDVRVGPGGVTIGPGERKRCRTVTTTVERNGRSVTKKPPPENLWAI